VQLLRKKDFTMSEQEAVGLQRSIQELGPAKALFNLLTQHTRQRPSTDPSNLIPGTSPKLSGAALYDQMVASQAGYSRRTMDFLSSPVAFDSENAPEMIKSYAASLGVSNGIRQIISSEDLHATIEALIREGDQQGLVDFVRPFLLTQLPTQFGQVPGLQKSLDLEAMSIAAKLERLVRQAWGQYTHETVSSTTHELVELMSVSINNLKIEEIPEMNPPNTGGWCECS